MLNRKVVTHLLLTHLLYYHFLLHPLLLVLLLLPYFISYAIHSHLLVTLFHWKSTRSRVEITVVVGSVAPAETKLAPQVIARAVPLSVICIIIISPLTGVPVRLVVIEVIA